MNYIKLRDTLRSGDIVLFRGTGLISTLILWFSSIFNWFKKTRFSHIGMIVVDGGRVMVLESTTLNDRNGVQLNSLSEILQTYKGRVYLRRLHCERNEQFYDVLTKTINELLGKPYEKNLVTLLGAAAEIMRVFVGHRPDLSSVFCSELVTEIFRRWGFLPQSIPPNFYEPQDYDFNNRIDDRLRFAESPVCLSEILKIK